MASLNLVDYLLIAIFFVSTLAGFFRGFIREVISLIALIAAFIVASMFANPLATAFTKMSSPEAVDKATNAATAATSATHTVGASTVVHASYLAIGVSYALLFIATLLVGAIIGYLLNIVFEAGILGFGNRLLGGLFGFCRGFLINLVIIFVVQLSSYGDSPKWKESQLVGAFQPVVQWLGDIVSPSLADLKEKFGKTLEDVNSSVDGASSKMSGVIHKFI